MEKLMERKTTLVDSARKFLERRSDLYNLVVNLPEYIASGTTLYPHDIISNNYPILVELLQASGSSDFLKEKDIETVLDVGGANGDLSFVFAEAGFETTLLDLSISYERSPLVASLINLQLGANVRLG
jgi:2-polyprenyl-3-methyl-5-hydroxy-6-metoxy-1,4-benzoquinol methylase